MAQTPTIGNNGLATATHSRYLVVCQSVEKFQPPDENNHREAEIASSPTLGENRLSIETPARYLVVCQSVAGWLPSGDKITRG
ncbi:hypothetical protein ES708_13201 [subsurface metagenome]|jgi:hypothetical protein